MENESTPQIVSLTKRETDVLRLIAKGFTTPEISAELGIGHETVLGYRKQLHKKLKVNKAAELIYRATEHQLL